MSDDIEGRHLVDDAALPSAWLFPSMEISQFQSRFTLRIAVTTNPEWTSDCNAVCSTENEGRAFLWRTPSTPSAQAPSARVAPSILQPTHPHLPLLQQLQVRSQSWIFPASTVQSPATQRPMKLVNPSSSAIRRALWQLIPPFECPHRQLIPVSESPHR